MFPVFSDILIIGLGFVINLPGLGIDTLSRYSSHDTILLWYCPMLSIIIYGIILWYCIIFKPFHPLVRVTPLLRWFTTLSTILQAEISVDFYYSNTQKCVHLHCLHSKISILNVWIDSILPCVYCYITLYLFFTPAPPLDNHWLFPRVPVIILFYFF